MSKIAKQKKKNCKDTENLNHHIIKENSLKNMMIKQYKRKERKEELKQKDISATISRSTQKNTDISIQQKG